MSNELESAEYDPRYVKFLFLIRGDIAIVRRDYRKPPRGDPYLECGLFMAMQNYSNETLDEKFREVKFEKSKVIFEHSGILKGVLSVDIKVDENVYREKLKEVLGCFRTKYSEDIQNWTGNLSAFEESGLEIDKMVQTQGNKVPEIYKIKINDYKDEFYEFTEDGHRLLDSRNLEYKQFYEGFGKEGLETLKSIGRDRMLPDSENVGAIYGYLVHKGYISIYDPFMVLIDSEEKGKELVESIDNIKNHKELMEEDNEKAVLFSLLNSCDGRSRLSEIQFKLRGMELSNKDLMKKLDYLGAFPI